MIERVVVTGASRGIGRAVVQALAARGSTVVAIGRDPVALDETASASPSRIHVLPADLADPAQRVDVVARAHRMLGSFDGLVNAAGIVRYDAVPNVGEARLREQLEVNFVVPVLLAQDFVRTLLEANAEGSIVNVSSTLARRPAASTLPYAASKAALDAATRGLALELAPRRIRANSVLLGIVDTAMVRLPRLRENDTLPTGATLDVRIAEELEALRRLTPLGRLGDADEVARTIVHVLDARWMTGSEVVLDGGLSL